MHGKERIRESTGSESSRILLAAVWFGLVVGLLEGTLLYGLQRTGLATWAMIRNGVDARILFVSPVLDLVLFFFVGLFWAIAAFLLRDRNVLSWAVGSFAVAGFYNMLATTDRLGDVASAALGLGLATQFTFWFRGHQHATLRFMRRSLPALTAVVLLIGLGMVGRRAGYFEPPVISRAGAGDSIKKPNVLLIVVDTLRADHLSAYGYSRQTSPNIDRFASQGALFENAYSSSSWTLPSHASLFTNLYSFENNVDPWFLDDEFPTLAEQLYGHGYRTAGFVGNTAWCTYATGVAQGFQSNAAYFHNFPDTIARTLFGRKALEEYGKRFGFTQNPRKKGADHVAGEFLAWVERHVDSAEPFFAFLNVYDPHEPCFPPPPYDGLFAPADRINNRRPMNTHDPVPPNVPLDRLQADIDAYDSTIAYVDAKIGEIWAQLERRGLAENTLLIITSDHGHSLGEGGVYGHRTSLRREQIHVPLILYWPGKVPAGVRVAAPVSQIHVPSTVTDLAGVPPAFPGYSLAGLWRDPPTPSETAPVLAELAAPRANMPGLDHGSVKTLVTDRWQYIEWENGTSQVFDFVADPREERDLSDTEEGRAMAAALRAKLETLLGGRPKWAPSPGGRVPD